MHLIQLSVHFDIETYNSIIANCLSCLDSFLVCREPENSYFFDFGSVG